MIKKILPILTLLATFNASASETWQGYKPIEKVSAPHKALAMSAVVQILGVNIAEKDKDNYEVVDVEGTKKGPKVPRLSSDHRTFQIETCRNQGLKKCPIFNVSYDGTGFINEGRDLYTCRHVVHNWVVVAAKVNSLSVNKISPPFELLDSKRTVLYSSASTKQPLMSFDAINTDKRINFVEDTSYREGFGSKLELLLAFSDFVAMKSAVDLIPAVSNKLSLALSKNDQIYLSGYPGSTELFGGIRKGDAPGDKLVSSTGNVADFSTAQQAILSNALATPGISGGMVTNSNGDVLGIVCQYALGANGSADGATSTSLFLNPQGHETFWTQLLQMPVN